MSNIIDDALCNMYDIKIVLKRHNLLDEPKDNEGTECTVGMIVDDTIEHLENIAIGGDPHEEKVTNE